MSIVSVDNIQPIGSGTSVTVNKSVTLESGNTNITGVCTATSFSGSGANLTNLPAQATVNNNADNRVITGGSGVNLYAESGFTYDGTTVQVPDRINYNTNGTYLKENQLAFNPTGTAYLDHSRTGQDIQIRMSTSSSLDTTGPTFKSNGNLAFASGKGIDFSADAHTSGMTGELLDDYETGTWTPDVVGSSGSDTWNYRRAGKYTKIGNKVTATWSLGQYNGNLSGSVYINNLPFTISFRQYGGDIGLYDVNVPSGTIIGYFVYLEASTTNVRLYWSRSGQQGTHMDGSDLIAGNRTFWEGNVTYYTNS